MKDSNRIALVGIACRLPGDSDTPQTFFENLAKQKNFVSEVPSTRWNLGRFYNKDNAVAGKSNVSRGHFINYDFRKFDAGFFGFAPREVEFFDPQQRLLLEVAWEAMENAGLDVQALAGSEVGVYVGGFTTDHLLNQLGASGRANIGTHSAAGATLTMLSNRLSYAFDFRGPSISIDTACSSSLVAFSYAVQDIAAGRCRAAMVGGVNMMLRPEYSIAMSKGKFLAPDGRSKSFDASADGYGRGEGAAIIILKPLEDALQDGDKVLAIVDAAGVNQDGNTNGITVPNQHAQEALMRRVLAESGVDPRTVQYVEAHGTGTPVGDPIEAAAIASVYGEGRASPCVIGSVKSNIGHLEAAAGIAGVVKAALMLQHNVIPPLATLDTPNPNIPFGDNGLQLATTTRPLATANETRRIAINSFGYGGTNAHAILSLPTELQAGEGVPQGETNDTQGCKLLPLSGQSENAVRDLAGRYAKQLVGDQEALQDILFSAARRRGHMRHRLAVWGDNKADIVEQLRNVAASGASTQAATGVRPFEGKPGPVFVYTGMGPQWWGMGQQLYQENPAYRRAVERADAIFQQIAGFSILAEMLKQEADSVITATRIAQPANFVLQVGLTEALQAEGIVPAAVVGHSVGEVASAWAAGALSLEDALLVSHHRSRIQATAAGQGGMLAIGVPLQRALELIEDMGEHVSIAAVNSPASVTLAGDESRLLELCQRLQGEDIFARMLTVEVPYHSPMMEPLKPELSAALGALVARPVHTPLYSTVTAARADTTPYDAGYWCDNIRLPVYFAKTVAAILQDDHSLFIEIGPRPVLRGALREIAAERQAQANCVQTLHPEQAETMSLRRAVAETYCHGGAVNWAQRHPVGRLVSLPNYPWQRETLWHEAELQRLDRQAEISRPLLGIAAAGRNAWSVGLGDSHLSYLADHVVDGVAVMPAAAYVEAMLEAVAESASGRLGCALREITIDQALLIDPEKPLRMELRLAENGRRASLISYSELTPERITQHASGRLHPLPGAEPKSIDLHAIKTRLPEATEIGSLYEKFTAFSLLYGPLFQPITQLYVDSVRGEVLARLELPAALGADVKHYCAHPVLLDGCFQMALSLLDPNDGAYLPTAIGELQLHRPLPPVLWCWGTLSLRSAQEIVCDLTLLDDQQEVVAKVRGFKCSALRGKRREQDHYPAGDYRYAWRPAQPVAAAPARRWLIASDTNDQLTETLQTRLATQLGAARKVIWNDIDPIDMSAAAEVDAVAVWLGDGINGDGHASDPIGETATVRMLALVQSLAALGELAPRVYLITRNAFAVVESDRCVIPAQGAMAGFLRVAHNEIGPLRATTIDVPLAHDGALLDSLVAELMADDEIDEVALRSEGRFFSELESNPLFTQQRLTTLDTSNGDRIEFIPAEGEAGIAAQAAAVITLEAHEIELRLEAAMLDGAEVAAALMGAGAMMAVVGQVERTGETVTELSAGDRLCGFVPAALASHVRFDPAAVVCSLVPTTLADTAVALSLTLRATALCLADAAGLQAGDTALVCETSLGAALTEVLEARGVVSLRSPGCAANWTIAAQEKLKQSAPEGFDCIAAPLDAWDAVFGFRDLAPGGCLIDIGGTEAPRPDAQVGRLIRFDRRVPNRRDKASLLAALQRAMLEQPLSAYTARVLTPADLADIGVEAFAGEQGHFIIDYTQGRSVSAAALDQVPVRADAAYLVTGGFGGLGRETARWLARSGAGHIALASRRGAAGEAEQAFLLELKNAGCQVSAHAVDVSDLAQVKGLFNAIDATGFALRGVLHTAGVLADKPIVDMQAADVSKVMRPKALGAWNLHVASEQRALDLFVLYSSVSVLVGNSRQANYCAANGLLDALAWQRRLAGLPALSVNFGAINAVGMLGKDEKIGAHLTQIGLTPLDFTIALNGIERAIAAAEPQVCIAAEIEWHKWSVYETVAAKSPRFRSLIESARATQDNSASARLRDHLLPLDPQGRHDIMTALITEVFARELKIPNDQLEPGRPLEQFGIDSLLATDIQLSLDNALNLSVSALELVGDITIGKLSSQSLSQLNLDHASAATV